MKYRVTCYSERKILELHDSKSKADQQARLHRDHTRHVVGVKKIDDTIPFLDNQQDPVNEEE